MHGSNGPKVDSQLPPGNSANNENPEKHNNLWNSFRAKGKIIGKLNAMNKATLHNYYGVKEDQDVEE